jgi:hypothetical protein
VTGTRLMYANRKGQLSLAGPEIFGGRRIRMVTRSLKRSMLICIALVTLVTISRRSAADPPDPRSGDGQLMAPYEDAVRALSQRNGAPCCSESDCRPASIGSTMPVVMRSLFASSQRMARAGKTAQTNGLKFPLNALRRPTGARICPLGSHAGSLDTCI